MSFSLKKRIICIFAVLMFLFSSLAVAMPVYAGEEPTMTEPEQFAGVKVSENGSVSLKYCYSSLGDADSVVVIHKSPSGTELERSVMNAEDIPTDTEGYRVITVKLAVAQMSDTVTVYTQKNGNRLGEEHTYSVKEYAEKVLADKSYAEYHKGLKSLLNLGAMAQQYFSVNTNSLANSAIYKNGNPINAVGDIECDAPVWTDGEKLTFAGYEAVLEGDTAFRIYFNYTGDNLNGLVASAERENIEPSDEKIYYHSESGSYYVKITNIAPTLYDKQYTVLVSDGEDTMSVCASLLNYLDDVISSNGTSEAQKNTARAMYQHYVWVKGVGPDVTVCAHGTLHQEYSNGGKATAYVCSLCGTMTHKIGNSVEINISASTIKDEYLKSDAEQTAELITDADGTVFARIHGGRPTGGYNSLYVHASTTKECGQYVVMKLRTPTDNPSNLPEKFYMYVKSTGSGSDWERVEFDAPADGEWHTVVLDLTDFATGDTGYIPATDGKYYTQMLWLRPLTNGSNVGTTEDVIDIAYIAMCNDIADVSEIIDEETYERHVSSRAHIVINTATGECLGRCLLEYSADGNTHSYKCAVCGSVDTTLSVDESMNYYSAPGTIKATAGDVYGSNTNGCVYYENGEIYQRIDVLNGGGTIPLTAGGGADEKHIVTANESTGKYMVLRMRTHNIENVVGLSWRIGSAAEGEAWTKPGSYVAERRVFEDDVWKTYVIDIEKLGISGYSVNDENETRIVAALMVRADAASSGASLTDTYIDVAYFAICDDWNEIDIATGDEKTVFITEWIGQAPLLETGSSGSCPEGECEYALDDSDGIKYVCTKCQGTVRVEVDPSINFYSAPGQTLNNWSAGYDRNGNANWDHDIRVEGGRVYEHIPLGASASFKFDNGTSEEIRRFPATSEISGGSGRYFVIRMRANNIPVKVGIVMNSDTSAQGSNMDLNGNASTMVSRSSAFINGEWQTYVIDLEKLAHPLYEAESADVKKIAVGFHISSLLASNNASIDVEYAAICDDWSEIDKIVEEKMVLLSGWRDGEAWRTVSAKDGGPGVDTSGEDAEKVIYEKKGNELYVYIRSPYAEKYTRYKFAYRKDAASAYEGWMIHSVAICDSDLNVLYYASPELATDLEGALQEYNTAYQATTGSALAGDFIGGGHGDEQYKTIKVTVDGAEIDMSMDHSIAACESIVAMIESDVFRWNTTEKVFDRTKTISWAETGMTITNNYKTVAPITIYRPAVGMLVVYGNNSGYDDIVTKHWDNISNEWKDVIWPDKPTGNHHQNLMTYAELDGDYVKASLEIKDFGINGVQTNSIGWFNYDVWSASNRRVKIYLDIFRNKSLAVGDVMHSTAVHTTFAKN